MERLIDITGYANTYEELCNKQAGAGEFYNVLSPKPFMTYMKTNDSEIGDTLKETDICGWYSNKAELESNVTKPDHGDVYVTGSHAPYLRWKAEYEGGVVKWVEDGESDQRIERKFKNVAMLTRSRVLPEEGVFYAVGKTAPYKIYGVISAWEPIGAFISRMPETKTSMINNAEKKSEGEVAFLNGIFYMYIGGKWEMIQTPEPLENTTLHTYTDGKKNYRLREGQYAGTLEFFEPRQ